MKILVFIKQTPDTEAQIKPDASGNQIDSTGVKMIINPYDEFAVEEALQIKARLGGDSEVVVASFGQATCREALLRALAMGADRAILLEQALELSADSLVVSRALAAIVQAETPQLVLCGKQGIDADNMHVPAMLAELLRWPHIGVLGSLELKNDGGVGVREAEGGRQETYSFKLPAVLATNKGLNKPRYVAVPGIIKAKKKPFATKQLSDYGLDPAVLQPGVKLESLELPPAKPAGQILEGEDVKVMVARLVELLRKEARVI